MTTEYPRAFKSRPRDAAVMPLPSEDATPPVMKTYFVATIATPRKNIFHLIAPDLLLQRVLGEHSIIF
jgi:hypothetical protein